MPSRREVYAMEGFKPSFGPSRLDESRFPTFRDGDVKIIITGSRQYQLHKSILKNSSPLFCELLSGDHTAILSNKAKKKGVVVTNLLRAEIRDDTEGGRKTTLVLKPVALDEDGRAISEKKTGLDLENGMAVPPVITACEKVLGAFYHQPINLNDFGDANLKAIMANSVEVLKVAEYLGCVPIITQHFEATLLATGQPVYQAISAAPNLWLDVATRMQSKHLYREAVVHAAGQYHTQDMRDSLLTFDTPTLELVSRKAEVIKEKVKEATSVMLSYYPTALQRRPSTGLVDKEDNMRISYANDILTWMALSIFRQWLAHVVALDETHHAEDLGYKFMNMVRAAGDAYLVDFDLQHFHEFFPMSQRSKTVIKDKLYEIKMHVRKWTLKFLKNESKLDVDKYPTGYFTCAKWREDDDYPWEVEVKQEGDDEAGDADDDEENDDEDGEDGSESGSEMDISDNKDNDSSAKSVKQEPASSAKNKPEYDDDEFEAELMRMDPEYEKARGSAHWAEQTLAQPSLSQKMLKLAGDGSE